MKCKNQFIFKKDLKRDVKGIKKLIKMSDEVKSGERQLEEELAKAIYRRCIELTNDISLYYYQINRINDNVWEDIYISREYFNQKTIGSCELGILYLCDKFNL